MKVKVSAIGPCGDKRLLEITIEKGIIAVHNLLAPVDTLVVRRECFGYEQHLSDVIESLQK